MTSTAADQLKRVLTLIPRLADGEPHPVADLAFIVGQSAEQLIDDLRQLVDRFDTPGGFVDAVQILYDGDTVSVVTPHFRRPMRLTMSELCALELGLAILRTERSQNDLAPIERALERLRSVISKIPGDDYQEGLTTGTLAAAGVDPEHMAALRTAIGERRKARLVYRKGSAEQDEERQVCPYAIRFVNGMWYVVALCEKAESLRVFRLDRIAAVTLADERYEVDEDFSLERVVEQSKALMPSQEQETLQVRYSPRVAKWIAEREEIQLESDGSVVVDHPLRDEHWAVRHVLQYGPEAEVISPARIRTRIAEALSSVQLPFTVSA